MDASWAAFLPLCTPAGLARGGLLGGLFLTGLVGSLVHCAPMCGGFVLGQAADRMARLPAARLCEWRRLQSGLLLPYHLGRLSTYAVLGALAGSPAAVLARTPAFAWVSAGLLLAAAAGFVLQALSAARVTGGRAPALVSAAVLRLARGIGRRHAASGYLLGATLGLLPCSFLYGALLAAAGAGSCTLGMAVMLCFGLGTVPALVLAAVAGHAGRLRWRRASVALTSGLLAWNVSMLIGNAWMQLAPVMPGPASP